MWNTCHNNHTVFYSERNLFLKIARSAEHTFQLHFRQGDVVVSLIDLDRHALTYMKNVRFPA